MTSGQRYVSPGRIVCAMMIGDEQRCRASLIYLRKYAALRAYRFWPHFRRRIAFIWAA